MIKSRINFMILLLVIMVMTGAALAFENEPEGFRGLKWGDPPTEEMIALPSQPLVNCYTLPDDLLYLGNVKLYLIGYQFYTAPEGEVFMAVGLYFRGEDNYDLMEVICKDKFGEEMEKTYNRIAWWSQKSMVVLNWDSIEEEGFLGMSSRPLLTEKIKAIEKLETEKAAKDW